MFIDSTIGAGGHLSFNSQGSVESLLAMTSWLRGYDEHIAYCPQQQPDYGFPAMSSVYNLRYLPFSGVMLSFVHLG